MHTMHQSDFLGSPISFLVFPKCFWNFWMINQSSQSCGNFLKKDRPTWKQTPWRHLTFRRSPAFSSLHPCLTKASQQNRPPRCPNGRPSSRSAPLKTLLPDQDPLSWSEFTTQLAGGTTLETPPDCLAHGCACRFVYGFNPELMKGTITGDDWTMTSLEHHPTLSFNENTLYSWHLLWW